jgi:Mg2+ and Co2+ transporter CorA
MNETRVENEVKQETSKNTKELIKDIIREANSLPKNTANEKDNLDIIKHLIKRLAIHQIVLEGKTNETNRWLLFLSIVSTIAAILSFLSLVCR